jgi:hypothetical protein
MQSSAADFALTYVTTPKTLETHDHQLFSTEHLRLYSLCNIFSDERIGFSFTIAAGQSFSGQIPAGLMTTFETPPTWRATSLYLYRPGIGWPEYTPRHWVPFPSPPTTSRATVEVFDPASTRASLSSAGHVSSLHSFESDPTENTVSIVISTIPQLLLIRCRTNVFAETLPSNGHLFWLHYSGFRPSCHYIIKLWTGSKGFRLGSQRKHNRSLKVAVQGLDLMAHPLYIHRFTELRLWTHERREHFLSSRTTISFSTRKPLHSKGFWRRCITLSITVFFLFFPSSGILRTTKHDVSETGSVSVLRCGGGDDSWVP